MGRKCSTRSAGAYERANRMALAEKSYTAASVAQMTSGAGGPKLRHLIYQGLTRTALAQGNDPAALAALARSAKVGQDDAAPFSYRLDAARRLLQRGYVREVLAYADAALEPRCQTMPMLPPCARRRRRRREDINSDCSGYRQAGMAGKE